MPNAAPPRARRAHARSGVENSGPATASVPALWVGLGDLVASMVERNPAEALTITNLADTQTGPTASVALKSLWDIPAAAAPTHSRFAVRTLDAGGRLSLPLVCDGVAELPAQRTQEVLTVYLPGSPSERRRSTGATVSLRGGRLTLGKALREQLGIADRADVLVLHDETASTLTLTAASRLDQSVADTLAGLSGRPQPTSDAEHTATASTHLRLVHDAPTANTEKDRT